MKRLELKLLMLSDSRAEREEEGKILFSYAKLRDAIFPRLFFATLHICNCRKRTRSLKHLQGGECHSRCAERLHFRPSFPPPEVCSIVVRLSSTPPAPKGRAIEEEGGSHMLVLSPSPLIIQIPGRNYRAAGEKERRGGNGQEALFQALWYAYELFFHITFFHDCMETVFLTSGPTI